MKVERKCKIVSKEQMGDAIYMTLECGDMVRTSFKPPASLSMSSAVRDCFCAVPFLCAPARKMSLRTF